MKLKEREFYLGAIRKNRLENCQLRDEKNLKKDCIGSFGYRVETTHLHCVIRWYDKRAVTFASFYLGPDPSDSVRTKAKKSMFLFLATFVVKSYNLMGGVDFIDSLILK